MSHHTKHGERFGRVTGHTLRRSPWGRDFAGHFVIEKKSQGSMKYDDMNGQLQELISDGNLHNSSNMVYSLNKQRRWELPGLLKESICNDRDSHEDLDFKVLLVEQHLDSQMAFRPACIGLYQSKTDRPERLPKKKYAHARDLQRRDPSNAEQEALRSRIHKLRCAKNRGGKKVNWRSLMDAMQERLREEEQIQDEEEGHIPQLRYEVGYNRPENKYPWRPEMSMPSKRPMGTKQRHKATTMFYMDDALGIEDDIQDDIYEEVRSHSEVESYPREDVIGKESHPMPTLGEALCGLTKKPKQCKKRRRINKSDPATTPAKKGLAASNQAMSKPMKVQHKGDVVYDPEGGIYKPKPKPKPKAQPQQVDIPVEKLPSVWLQLDRESIRPSGLEENFGRAYAEAECKPRKFAVQVINNEADLSWDPRNNVYVLFECSEDEPTTVECTESEVQTWQVVKEGVHTRMTVYGRSDRVAVSSENLAAAFPSSDIVSVQEVMKFLQTELQKSSTSWNIGFQKSVCSRSRHISSDIPTVRAALGWDCRFFTADEAYREITSRQTPQSSDDSHVQDTSACSDECGICYTNLSVKASDEASATSPSVGSMVATALLLCGHRFCNDCWRQYMRSGVNQGATDISCPEYKCKTPVDPVTTMAFLSPAQFHAHYRRCRDTTLARSTQCHRCPNPLCGRIAQMEDVGCEEARLNDTGIMVRCRCGWLWCTECKQEGHWPASCQQAKDCRKLLRKKLGEKETPLITHVQVKHCPKCKTRWEKDGGCPSMFCGTCRLNFCWLCQRPFADHNWETCRKSVTSLETVTLDYKTRSKSYMLELAVEHHKLRVWTSLKKGWFAATKLASRSAMAHVSSQRSEGFCTTLLVASDVVLATASANNHQPLTWARTQEHLEMMKRRAEEGYEISAFCHECNFVLEHLAFLLGSLTRRQRKAKWWRAMMKLRFIVQNLQETLHNLPNIKWSELEVTMDRLCRLMHAGKECLTKLAQSMPSTVPRGRSITHC